VPFFVPRQRGTKILVSISSPPKPKKILETAESQYLYGKIDSRNDELIIGGNYWSIYLFMVLTFNLILILILTGAGAPQLCRRARTPRKRACATLGAF
jgi:hypothetical protein